MKSNQIKSLRIAAWALRTRQDKLEIISESETDMVVVYRVKNNSFRYRITHNQGRDVVVDRVI